jgi:hypothetical protein
MACDHTIRRCCSGVIAPRGSWPCCAADAGGVVGLSIMLDVLSNQKSKMLIDTKEKRKWKLKAATSGFRRLQPVGQLRRT